MVDGITCLCHQVQLWPASYGRYWTVRKWSWEGVGLCWWGRGLIPRYLEKSWDNGSRVSMLTPGIRAYQGDRRLRSVETRGGNGISLLGGERWRQLERDLLLQGQFHKQKYGGHLEPGTGTGNGTGRKTGKTPWFRNSGVVLMEPQGSQYTQIQKKM